MNRFTIDSHELWLRTLDWIIQMNRFKRMFCSIGINCKLMNGFVQLLLMNNPWWRAQDDFFLFFSQTMPKINWEEVSKSHLRNEQLLYSNRRKQEKNPEGLHFFCCCSYLLFISFNYIFFQHKWQINKNL